MINANELRVGNCVNFSEEAPVKTEYIGSVEKITSSILSSILTYGFEKFYNPIPLTHEILEKCGFEYEDDQTGMCYFRKNVYMYFDGEALSANFGHIKQLDVYVKYLHQLQNLYFALTWEELNIQL